MEVLQVRKWDRPDRPSKDAIKHLLGAEGLDAYSWSNGPGDAYEEHLHGYHKILYVVEGSILFCLPDEGDEVKLYPGDRLELPAGTRHSAVVGPEGVTCLEAHR